MAHPYSSRPVAASHVWLTPPEILRSLGRFDLDPCAAPSPRPWETAERHIELPEDGLNSAWNGRVWCNPPFGNFTGAWLKRMAEHGNGIALTFARTETKMFENWVWPKADSILFLYRRPHFFNPDGTKAKGNSGGPICLIAYGSINTFALSKSGLEGSLVRTVHTQEHYRGVDRKSQAAGDNE